MGDREIRLVVGSSREVENTGSAKLQSVDIVVVMAAWRRNSVSSSLWPWLVWGGRPNSFSRSKQSQCNIILILKTSTTIIIVSPIKHVTVLVVLCLVVFIVSVLMESVSNHNGWG